MAETASPLGFAIWLTGLPSSGKSTVAHALEILLSERGLPVQILDSDDLRRILTPEPTYSSQERDWFYGVLTFLAALLTDNGVNVLIAATAPKRIYRHGARSQISRFAEVYVECPLEVCQSRDSKGLWERAEQGQIDSLPGAGVTYEEPLSPEVTIDTTTFSPDAAAPRIVHELDRQGFFCQSPCA